MKITAKNFEKRLKNNNINYTKDGNNLTVGGSLNLQGTNITSLPDNLTVGGWLDLRGTNITSLPDNLTVGGSLDLQGTNITSLPDNLTVGGSLDLQGINITSLPDNLTVGGWLNLQGTNITSLPDNLTVGGWLDLQGTNITSLPDNLTVGSWLNLQGTNITSLPDNLTVGGWLDLQGTNIKYKKTKQPNKNFMKDFYNEVQTALNWQNGRYRKIDGIFCEVITAKGNILKTKSQGKTAYIFFKNDVYAHGNTVKQAYLDWLFKTSDRDVSQYQGIDKDAEKDFNYWVIAYRTITGACSFGTNNYLENNQDKYKDKMTLQEVLTATEGQYGHNTFREFFERT